MNPAEITAAIEAFQVLEPQAQAGIVALIHLLHKKPPSAQDFINQAQALLAKVPPVNG